MVGDHRQDQVRGMLWRVVYGVSGRDFYRRCARVFSRVAVDIETGEIAGRDIQANSVASDKQVASGQELDSHGVDLTRLQRFRLFPGITEFSPQDTVG